MATSKLSPRVKSSNQTSLFGLDVSQGVVSVAKQAKNYIGGVIDPSKRRLDNAGLRKGAEQTSKEASTAKFSDEDWRVRLSLPTTNKILYHDETNTVMHGPLSATRGLIFPYTPQILFQHSSNYSASNPVHSNYTQHFYSNSAVDAINIAGDFTAQNPAEAAYVVAAITFLRSATKMFFGERDGALAGTPPPILNLNGYGDYIFNNVPVVISNFTVDFSGDVDYINTHIGSAQSGGTKKVERYDEDGGSWFEEVAVPGAVTTSSTRVPTRTSINVTVNPLYSRERMKDFGLNDFAAGRLIDRTASQSGSGKGGFI